jgi:uncharacterized membrane protein YedE/YeeE
MDEVMNLLRGSWPWYVAGPLIGLTVPALLIFGNKSFGISSSMRHICASCFPANIPFFKYDWKKEVWNLFFVAGILVGGIIAASFLGSDEAIKISEGLRAELAGYDITEINSLVPSQIFSFSNLFTLQGVILIVVGGFLVGFGTRYAGGCTSGHAIMGLSNLQWPSLVATCCFMAGGFLMANFILPYVLSL